MLSRFVIPFLPRSKYLLISWLQSLSTVIMKPNKICHCFHFSPSICHEVMGSDVMTLVFWILSLKLAFSLFSFILIKSPLVPLHFLLLKGYHLHIWGCWYFSHQFWFQLVIYPPWHLTWRTLHLSSISRVTVNSLEVLLSQFRASQLFHIQF